jgi:hypothetical protein
MTSYRCYCCGRDLRLVPHKLDEDGRRWCLGCSPADDPVSSSGSLATPIAVAFLHSRAETNGSCELWA